MTMFKFFKHKNWVYSKEYTTDLYFTDKETKAQRDKAPPNIIQLVINWNTDRTSGSPVPQCSLLTNNPLMWSQSVSLSLGCVRARWINTNGSRPMTMREESSLDLSWDLGKASAGQGVCSVQYVCNHRPSVTCSQIVSDTESIHLRFRVEYLLFRVLKKPK